MGMDLFDLEDVPEVRFHIMIADVLHQASLGQFFKLFEELREWDKELYEFCKNSKECKHQLLKIAIESAATVLRWIFEVAVEAELEAADEAYRRATASTDYHT